MRKIFSAATLAVLVWQTALAQDQKILVEDKRVERESFTGVLGSRAIMETPYTINSYDASLIEDRQLVTANQVLRHDPALTNVSTAGGFSAFNLSFRGFPSGADAVTFYGMGPGAMFSGSLGQLYSVERIDVIKAPSAGLGSFSPSAAVGGSVNIMPKLPADTNRRMVSLGFRELGIISSHIDLNHKLSETTAVRLNLASEAGETFYEGRDERDVAALAIRQKAGDNAEFIFGYDQVRIKSEGYQNGFVLASGVPVPRAPNPNRNHFQKWTYLEQEWNYGYASLNWYPAKDWNLFIQGLHGIRRRPILSSGTGLIRSEDGDLLLRPNYFAKGTRYKPFFGGNAFLSTRFQTAAWRHHVTLSFLGNGFDFITAQGAPLPTIPSHLHRPVYVDRPPLYTAAVGTTSKLNSQTLALSDDMQLTDRLGVLWGVKNNTLKSEAFDVETKEQALKRQDTATTPFAALNYKVLDRSMVYLSYAEGLERGGIAPVSAANANEVLPPVRNHQIELGLKSETWSGLMVAGALFQIERGLEYLDAEFNSYKQDGLQRNRGLELNVNGRVTERISLHGGLLILDPRIIRNGQVQDKKAPGAPDVTLPLSAVWQLSSRVHMTTSLYHFGPQYVDADNTRRLKPWTRFDAGMKVDLRMSERALTLQLQVENIGNQSYWASAAGGQLTLGSPEIWKAAVRMEI